MLSPEMRWIVDCLRFLGRREAPSPPASLNWDRVLETAEAEGLAPALGVALRAHPQPAMPGAVKERLSRNFAEATARHLRLRRELGRLLQGFARAGIPVIPLKGLALAEMLYPDPALRVSTDLDLLVRPEAVLPVDGLLRDLGYRRVADAHSWSFDLAYDHATLYGGPDGVPVDLHWALLSDPRYVWNERESLAVWDRAVKTQLAGEEALALCPEDLLLYLAAHLAVHHAFTGLVWYWDCALLLRRWQDRLDWSVIRERASAWRVRSALYFVLRGCQRLFGVSAPATVTASLRRRGPRALTMERLLRHRHAERLGRLEHLIALLLVDRGRDLLGPLGHLLWPAPAWVRARYDGEGTSAVSAYLAHYRRMGAIALGMTVRSGHDQQR